MSDATVRPRRPLPNTAIVATCGRSLLIAGAAVALLRALPQGFPADHPRFWANQVGPWLLILLAAGAFTAAVRRSVAGVATAWIFAGAGGLGLLVAAVFRYPNSALLFWVLLVTFVLAVLPGALLMTRQARLPLPIAGALIVAGLTLGIVAAESQRAPAPSTTPHAAGDTTRQTPTPPRQVPDWLQLDADSGRFRASAGGAALLLDPRMRFRSVSPDRGWTLWLPREIALTPPALRQSLDLEISGPGEAVVFDARSYLTEPIYSHLNHIAAVQLEQLQEPAIRFSAAPDHWIDLLPADYPTGAPARFAYLGADAKLHVVQATSAEKGPFHTLASGTLSPGDPLTIEVRSDGATRFELTLLDWTRQASLALSPTAGWGVPQNAIEFQSSPDRSEASIWITLAATSVGRGFDSVGHAAGTYQHRVRLRRLP